MNPVVSVIIPVYNTGAYLPQCLESVLNQTFSDIEVICIDDGSTDNSWEILEAFSKKDSRVKLFRQENKWQAAARNVGIRAASGKYIYFIDSDDYIVCDTLEKLVFKAETEDLDLVLFDADSFFETKELEESFKDFKGNYRRVGNYDGAFKGEDLFCEMVKNGEYRVSVCLQIIRKDILDDNQILFREGIIYEDNLFALQVILSAKRAGHLKEAFYQRRVREGSTMTRKIEYRNFEGYLVAMAGMLEFLKQGEYKETTVDAALGIINDLFDVDYGYFKMLPEEQRILKISLQDDLGENKSKATNGATKDNNSEDSKILKENNNLVEKALPERFDRDELFAMKLLLSEMNSRYRQEKRLTSEMEALRREVSEIRGSNTYKLGRALTAPVRKVKDRNVQN